MAEAAVSVTAYLSTGKLSPSQEVVIPVNFSSFYGNAPLASCQGVLFDANCLAPNLTNFVRLRVRPKLWGDNFLQGGGRGVTIHHVCHGDQSFFCFSGLPCLRPLARRPPSAQPQSHADATTSWPPPWTSRMLRMTLSTDPPRGSYSTSFHTIYSLLFLHGLPFLINVRIRRKIRMTLVSCFIIHLYE